MLLHNIQFIKICLINKIMNNLMNEIDFYHSLNFLSLSVILSIISKILINSVIFNSKENDEESILILKKFKAIIQ